VQFSVDSASMPTKKLMGLFSFMADPRSDLLAKSSRDLRSKHRPCNQLFELATFNKQRCARSAIGGAYYEARLVSLNA